MAQTQLQINNDQKVGDSVKKKETVEDSEKDEDSDITKDNDHKLLIAIAYNVRKLEGQNEKIVTALKQNNRYLRSIHRNMKALLALHDAELNNDN